MIIQDWERASKPMTKYHVGQLVEFILDMFEENPVWIMGIVVEIGTDMIYTIESIDSTYFVFRPTKALRACYDTCEFRDLAEGLTDEDLMAR